MTHPLGVDQQGTAPHIQPLMLPTKQGSNGTLFHSLWYIKDAKKKLTGLVEEANTTSDCLL